MKRIIAITTAIILASLPISAQSPFRTKGKTPIQMQEQVQVRMIEKTIMGSVMVLDHSYQLLDTTRHLLMGRGESESYGHTLSIAVVADSALIVPQAYTDPWRHDTNYKPREHFIPQLFDTKIRILTDTVYTLADISDSASPCANGLFRIPFATKTAFAVDSSTGKKGGFYVMFSAANKLEDHPCEKVTCIVVEKEFETQPGQISYDLGVPPPFVGTLLGGFYLVPCYEEYGTLSFELVGVLQQVGSTWKTLTFNK